MDTINLSPKTYEEKVELFNKYFSSGSNTSASFEQKLELIRLICFLSYVMINKSPEVYKNTKDVLSAIYDNDFSTTGLTDGFFILCDDLMYGVTEYNNPGYKNANEIVEKIKSLITQWLPF